MVVASAQGACLVMVLPEIFEALPKEIQLKLFDSIVGQQVVGFRGGCGAMISQLSQGLLVQIRKHTWMQFEQYGVQAVDSDRHRRVVALHRLLEW